MNLLLDKKRIRHANLEISLLIKDVYRYKTNKQLVKKTTKKKQKKKKKNQDYCDVVC